jgi:hypothetical protein
MQLGKRTCLALLAVASSFADQAAPLLTDADQAAVLSEQLKAEQADHAVDKAKADYFAALLQRDKSFAEVQKAVNQLLGKYGCSTEEIAGQVCQLAETVPDKTSKAKLSVVRKPH